MFRSLLQTSAQSWTARYAAVFMALVGANLVFNVVANAGFKVSALSPTWRGFLVWQVVGNLAAFVTVLTLTGMLRFVDLRIAFPLSSGLAVVGVQVFAAHWLFHEPISPVQWLGTLLVVAGILLIGGR